MSKAGIWIGSWVIATALLAHAGDEVTRTSRSHAEMLKSKATGGTEGSCATYCVRYLGGDFVLSSKNEVYRIDNQDKVRGFAGQKVKITGTLESKSKTIHLLEIEAVD